MPDHEQPVRELIRPLNLPLTAEQFRSALRSGHGRALRQVAAHGIEGLEEVLIEACTWCTAYDSQVEGPRGRWLVEIVWAAGLCAEVVEAVRHVASSEQEDETYWDRTHRCSVLQHLAVRGTPGARELLYSMLRPSPWSSGFEGDSEIVALDGEAGLAFVARSIGQVLGTGRDLWVDDSLLQEFDETAGSGAARRALQTEAVTDADISRFLTELTTQSSAEPTPASASGPDEPKEAGGSRDRLQAMSAEEVISLVRSDPDERCLWLTSWGARAHSSALETVFEAMLSESSESRLVHYLRVFRLAKVPRIDDTFLSWVEREGELGEGAVRAIDDRSDPRVRRAAARSLSSPLANASALRLLKANFQPGDHLLIERVLSRLEGDEEIHDACFDLLDVYEPNLVPEAFPALCFVYQKSPCSACRSRAVRLLAHLGSLPAWILEEAKLDANEEIRDLRWDRP